MNREQTVICHFSTTEGTSNLSHTAICMYETKHVWRSRTPDDVRNAHFPSDITPIMDQK
jgi:hypothetical protein